MYSIPQTFTPAAKSHVEAHVAFMNDMSKSLFRTAQQYCDLNLQLAQTMLDELTIAGQQMLTTQQPNDALNIPLAHVQPSLEKLRAYQQHLSRIAANTHVDMAKVAEQHISETSRTAKALAEDVARIAAEQTEKTARTQQEAMHRMAASFDRYADGQQRGSLDGLERRSGQSEDKRAAGAPVHAASGGDGGRQPAGRRDN
jgi:phasin family protein